MPQSPRSSPRGSYSLATRIFVAQLVLVALVVLVVSTASYLTLGPRPTTSLPSACSRSHRPWPTIPLWSRRCRRADPTAALQPFASMIVSTRIGGLRDHHGHRPDPLHPPHRRRDRARLRRQRGPRAGGPARWRTITGTLGPSVRAIAPICDAEGRVTAMVCRGRHAAVTWAPPRPRSFRRRCWWACWRRGSGAFSPMRWAATCAAPPWATARRSCAGSTPTTSPPCIRCARAWCWSMPRAGWCCTTTRPHSCWACRRPARCARCRWTRWDCPRPLPSSLPPGGGPPTRST